MDIYQERLHKLNIHVVIMTTWWLKMIYDIGTHSRELPNRNL